MLWKCICKEKRWTDADPVLLQLLGCQLQHSMHCKSASTLNFKKSYFSLILQSHTILLVQPTKRPEGRTYADYESVNECMEGMSLVDCIVFIISILMNVLSSVLQMLTSLPFQWESMRLSVLLLWRKIHLSIACCISLQVFAKCMKSIWRGWIQTVPPSHMTSVSYLTS